MIQEIPKFISLLARKFVLWWSLRWIIPTIVYILTILYVLTKSIFEICMISRLYSSVVLELSWLWYKHFKKIRGLTNLTKTGQNGSTNGSHFIKSHYFVFLHIFHRRIIRNKRIEPPELKYCTIYLINICRNLFDDK